MEEVYIDYQHFLYPEKVFGNPGENIIWEGNDWNGNYGKMVLLDSKYDKDTETTYRAILYARKG